MNETDVREIIVRPLLERLGFKHGTQANIRTEVSLKYDKAFLGHKNPRKDPPLSGRADYICDAISYGRWAVEVKGPAHALRRDDAEQAHTYCAHPEISASYFLLTNGRSFRLYEVGKLDEPVLQWPYEAMNDHLLTLFNIVGPEAIRKRAALLRPDVNRPLGVGLRSRLRIIGGEVKYGEHRSTHPLLQVDAMNGMVGTVTGGAVARADDGRLHARVSMRSPYQHMAELNRLAGLETFDFLSADEFISTDVERPTIFQNVVEGQIAPGVKAKLLPGIEFPMPFGFQFTVFAEATGYVGDDLFQGVISFDYDYRFIRGLRTGIPQLDAMAANMPPTARLTGVGEFNIRFTGKPEPAKASN
jgi:hypothetical protein